MNTKTALAILSIVALLVAMIATSIVSIAYAVPEEDTKQGGPKAQRNYGDCKEDFNDNVCKREHTGSD
jgi:hypothetical protein